MKVKYVSVILSILLALSLLVSLASAPDPGPVKFTVVKNFPDVIYAGSYYEAGYSVVNVANRDIPAGVDLTVIGPDLWGGEFTVKMIFNGVDAELEEVKPGVFRSKHFWIEPKSSNTLIIGIRSVPNILPADYTLITNFYTMVGVILRAVGRITTHVDARDEAGVTIEFTPEEYATIAVVDLKGNPYPSVARPPGRRSLDRYVDISTDTDEFTALIRFYYTDGEVAGFVESSLRLYYFDGTSWHLCEDTGVNTVENYVWALVTHFTPFATFGRVRIPYVAPYRAPAEFEVSSLEIEPETVLVGEEVEISVEVSNVGERTGTHTVTLLVNDTVEATVDVSLSGGESMTVSFKVVEAEAGTYLIEVDGLSGSFEVEEEIPPKPAEFEVKDLSISPSTVYPGEPVTIRAEIENDGEEAGEYTVELLINETIEASETVTLEGGESTTVTFTVRKGVQGEYFVKVEALEGSFTVVPRPIPPKPAEFEVSDFSITPDAVEPGETVDVSVTVTNIGELEGSYDVTLMIDEAVEAVETITLDGGESADVLFTVTTEEPKTYTVEVHGLEGSFTVTTPPSAVPTPAYIAGGVIIVASIIGAILLRRRR